VESRYRQVMTTACDAPLPFLAGRIACGASWIVSLAGCLVLTGWFFDLLALKSLDMKKFLSVLDEALKEREADHAGRNA
jgi:hypothetical protein